MVKCHTIPVQEEKETCLKDKLQNIQSYVGKHPDDTDAILIGNYYLQVAIANPKMIKIERKRLSTIQSEWAEKRRNIIDFMLTTFQTIFEKVEKELHNQTNERPL